MKATFRIYGLHEERQVFLQLPKKLARTAQALTDVTAEKTAAEIRAAYPIGPAKFVKGTMRPGGNLRRGVRVVKSRRASEYLASSRIEQRAPHAHLYEMGTQGPREDFEGNNRGPMPAKPTFIPIIIRNRAAMQERLRMIQTVEGITLTGDVDFDFALGSSSVVIKGAPGVI